MESQAVTPIVLSDDEARELQRFTRHDYISGRDYPALLRLLLRVDQRVETLTRAPQN